MDAPLVCGSMHFERFDNPTAHGLSRCVPKACHVNNGDWPSLILVFPIYVFIHRLYGRKSPDAKHLAAVFERRTRLSL